MTSEMLPYLGMAIVIAIIGIQLLFCFLMKLLGARGKPNEFITLWFVVRAIFLAPFCEELLYRGPIYLIFHNKFSFWTWLVIIGLGLFFGFLHLLKADEHYSGLNKLGFLTIFVGTTLVMILLGWLTVKTNSLLPSMLCHAAVNLDYVISLAIEQK